MVLKSRMKTFLTVVLAMVMMVFVAMVMGLSGVKDAGAETPPTIASLDDLTFTLVTDGDGEQSYNVAIKATSRPTVQTIVVPETYENLPVTAVADGAFLSCANLEKVVLPLSIETIGMNAFMNCAKLEQVIIPPQVTSIGANAFGMCAQLDNLYIPQSVTTVGATILRNNANAVYIQAAMPGAGWSATWSDYFTGQLYTNTDPSDMSQYREILDASNNVIGYELVDVGVAAYDTVIYSSYSPDPATEAYKPVLNICPGAFTLAVGNSLTIKHRHIDDPTAPVFDHAINIRSQAFAQSFIDNINIEVDTTYYHPENLQGGPYYSKFDFSLIEGDENGRSTKIFYQAYLKTLTLSDMDIITDSMFDECTYLEKIQIAGEEYTGENWLPEVASIGDKAFNACVSLENVYIPDTVLSGESIFNGWGDGYIHETQTIYLDRYADEISDWNTNWNTGINNAKVTITYKQPIAVTLHYEDGTSATGTILVKPGRPMPAAEMPVRNGYIFRGYFAQPNGSGLQYYTDTMESARNWNEGDPTDLYALWEQETFDITYVVDWKGLENPNPTEYEEGDAFTFELLEYPGYSFAWNIPGITADMTGDKTIVGTWTPIQYAITYNVDLQGLTNPNPTYYTVETLPITFIELERTGYNFEWSPSSLPVGTLGAKTVTGIWSPQEYYIYFNPNGGTGNIEEIDSEYDASVTLPNAEGFTRTGYYVERWQTEAGTFTAGVGTSAAGTQFEFGATALAQNIGQTLYAVWKPNDVTINFNANGGNGTTTQTAKYDTVIAIRDGTGFTRTGYSVTGWQTEAGTFTAGSGTSAAGTQYEITDTYLIQNLPETLYAVWEPNNVTVTFNANGGSGSATQSALYDNNITLRNGSGFSRTGYYIEKWQTLPGTFTAGVGTSAAGIQYNFGTTDFVQNFATPLYAVWKPNSVTITFNANGGSGSATQSALYDNGIMLRGSAGFSRTGYYVARWQSQQGSFSTISGTSAAGTQYEIGETDLVQNFPTTLYAVWKPITYTFVFNANGGSGYMSNSVHTYGNGKNLPIGTFERYGYKFEGWSTTSSGGVSLSDGQYIYNYTTTNNRIINLYAVWKYVKYTVMYQCQYPGVGAYGPSDVKDLVWGESWTITGAVGENNSNQFVRWDIYEYDSNWMNGVLKETIYDKVITIKNIRDYEAFICYWAIYEEIPNSGGGGCVAPGTLITLADGTQSAVENLERGDMLLVWNYFTGTFDVAPVLFLDSEPAESVEIIELIFSDGTSVKVIYEHAFWDITLNRYVYFRDGESTEYIGHWFNKQITDANGNMIWTAVQLVDVDIYTEYTTAWSPVTELHLNFYVNGMLSMPGATDGITNIFEVDAETMKYDEMAMQADIEEYGLFTYEEVNAIYPLPEIMFDECGVKYFKVAIGKGMFDIETLGALIERYSEFFIFTE